MAGVHVVWSMRGAVAVHLVPHARVVMLMRFVVHALPPLLTICAARAKIVHYENKSPQFPGSVVFGTRVGENKVISGGI
jgi:hypothetical protein